MFYTKTTQVRKRGQEILDFAAFSLKDVISHRAIRQKHSHFGKFQ